MEKKSFLEWALILLSFGALSIGVTAGPLWMKFYYFNGGKLTWFPSWIETAGWPLLFVPIWVSASYNKKHGQTCNSIKHISPKLALASIGIGLLIGLDNFMYSKGLSYFPLSTTALLNAAQLAFNALFSFVLVRQKFTPYSINAILLLTVAIVMLSFNSQNDTPNQDTHSERKNTPEDVIQDHSYPWRLASSSPSKDAQPSKRKRRYLMELSRILTFVTCDFVKRWGRQLTADVSDMPFTGCLDVVSQSIR